MRPCTSWAVMLDRGKVGEGWVSVSMFDAAGKFFPEVGEQWIELSLALTGDCQKVRGSRWTEDEPQSFGMVNIFFVYSSVFESDHNSVLANHINNQS